MLILKEKPKASYMTAQDYLTESEQEFRAFQRNYESFRTEVIEKLMKFYLSSMKTTCSGQAQNGQLQIKPCVLLLGNGINRAYDFASWDGLLLSLQNKPLGDEDKKVLDGVPYPLQAVIMSGDHVDEQMKNISMHLAELIPSEEEQKVLRQFAQLPIEAILTTNYTYEMEKSLSTDFSCKAGCKCKYRKSRNPDASKYEAEQLYTCFELSENTPSIWHIHGEAARPGTMIIGHYYYGKLIAKAQKYLAVHMASYKSFVYGKTDYMPNSWLDYFMLGDVYIIGLGMDLSEMDLWWLVNYKNGISHTRKLPFLSLT